MKLGVCTVILHDKPLGEALAAIGDLGLDGAEINSGGFVPANHLRIAAIRPARTPGTSTSQPSPRPPSS